MVLMGIYLEYGIYYRLGLKSSQLSPQHLVAPVEGASFKIIYKVSLLEGGRLKTSFRVDNLGSTSFEFAQLLHTYFRVEVRYSIGYAVLEHMHRHS